MALCSDALVELLHAAGYGVKGVSLFSDYMPHIHDTPIVYAVSEDPNFAWNPFSGVSSANTAFVELRVRASALQYNEANEAALRTWKWLSRLTQTDVTLDLGDDTYKVRILGVNANYPPHLLRRDELDQPVFACDMQVTWTLPEEVGP